jgi:hypothetical protein
MTDKVGLLTRGAELLLKSTGKLCHSLQRKNYKSTLAAIFGRHKYLVLVSKICILW